MAQAGDKLIFYLYSHYKSIMTTGTVMLAGDTSRCKGAGALQISHLKVNTHHSGILSDHTEREIGIVTEFLKHHPGSTADETADATQIERVEVFYCLNVLVQRNIVAVMNSKPVRWLLK